jgi:hypothetical protein
MAGEPGTWQGGGGGRRGRRGGKVSAAAAAAAGGGRRGTGRRPPGVDPRHTPVPAPVARPAGGPAVHWDGVTTLLGARGAGLRRGKAWHVRGVGHARSRSAAPRPFPRRGKG